MAEADRNGGDADVCREWQSRQFCCHLRAL